MGLGALKDRARTRLVERTSTRLWVVVRRPVTQTWRMRYAGCVTHEHVSGYAVHGSRMQVMRRAGQRDAHRAHTSAVLSFENIGVPGVLVVKPYLTLPGYLVLDKNFPRKI